MSAPAPKLSDIRFAAMNLLAMREHSVKELQEKLERKFVDSALVAQAISELIAHNLQSDQRFAEAFVAMRQRQGKGSLLIKMELRERGVAPDLVSMTVDETALLWLELAREVRIKRFGANSPADRCERAKQMRFLNSRGFNSGHIQRLFADTGADDID